MNKSKSQNTRETHQAIQYFRPYCALHCTCVKQSTFPSVPAEIKSSSYKPIHKNHLTTNCNQHLHFCLYFDFSLYCLLPKYCSLYLELHTSLSRYPFSIPLPSTLPFYLSSNSFPPFIPHLPFIHSSLNYVLSFAMLWSLFR